MVLLFCFPNRINLKHIVEVVWQVVCAAVATRRNVVIIEI